MTTCPVTRSSEARYVSVVTRSDPAEGVAQADDVAGLDRLVEEDDDTRHKVRHDLLKPKADAQADGPRQDRKPGQIKPQRAQPGDDGTAEEDQLQRLGGQRAHRGGDILAARNPVGQDTQHRSASRKIPRAAV